jgi:hypothetical protein
MNQEPLFELPGPHTGATHPSTSREAARVASERISRKRLEVLLAYAAQGRMTDVQLRAYLNKAGVHSESGPRARRSELVEAHLVEIVGETRNEAGNRVLIFDLSEEGRTYLEDRGLWTFPT